MQNYCRSACKSSCNGGSQMLVVGYVYFLDSRELDDGIQGLFLGSPMIF